jgi:Regulator of volume decrease after cellular swelling
MCVGKSTFASVDSIMYAVDAIFEALCDGAEANPDAVQEDEGEFFYNEEEVAAGMDEEARQRLEALEARLQLPDDADGDVNGTQGERAEGQNHDAADDEP